MPQGTHHWVLTLESPGLGSLTRYGDITPEPGDTRSDVFARIRASLVAGYPGMANANTVFWSLEPNRL